MELKEEHMSVWHTKRCYACSKIWSMHTWNEDGCPTKCPICGGRVHDDYTEVDDKFPDDRGRNGINFGQDW